MELMKLKPIARTAIWGKNEVGKYFDYSDFPDDTGQCWCASCHDEGSNEIIDGPYKGMLLRELWENKKELFKTNTEKFPWIIGLVAPSEDLSIQVHPDDEYSKLNNLSDSGKNEGWYFLESKEGNSIIYGHNAKSLDNFKDYINKGKWDDLLKKLPVRKNDFVYIPAKTIHALCKDTIVYEIQENSNLTYRFYDYDRKDNSGNKRELHIKESLDNLNIPFEIYNNKETVSYVNGQEIRTLVSNNSFELTLLNVNKNLDFNVKNTFSIISVLRGEGKINNKECRIGDNLLLLGDNEILRIDGNIEVIICNEKKI